ncbi:MAG: Maf family nucleotide pyrophosphatase [Anaerolineales bacterium]
MFKGLFVLESQPMSEKTTLVLASNSPRRKQLLSLGGWAFSVRVADVDESQRPGEAPGEYVLRLAEAKARKSAESMGAGQIVLAADTAVVDAGDILGKPGDVSDAVRMLERLRGHTHQVCTGVALLRVSDSYIQTSLSVTDVPMRNYTDAEIAAYVATGDPLDKAGAYAIQHDGFRPVENLTGCYASVMGLPLCRVTALLAEIGLSPRAQVDLKCQTELRYPCSVADRELRSDLIVQ